MNDCKIKLEQARKAFEKEDYKLSLELYETINLQSLEACDLRMFTFSLMEVARYDEAINVLNLWKAVEPESPILYSMLSYCYKDINQIPLAITNLDKSLSFKPRPSGFCALGGLYVESGHTDQAIKCYKNALRLDPSYEEASSALNSLKIK